MNAASGEPRPWPRHRWWSLIALVFAAQVGLIFALGNHKPIAPRRPGPAPELHLATGRSELLALNDPTLFALPHSRGFAAAAWRHVSQHEFPPFRWIEPKKTTGWSLAVEQLGSAFLRFMETNTFARVGFETLPAPELVWPETPPQPAPAARSVLRVVGDLAQRRLQNPVQLRSWPSGDLLTNSVVQTWVDAAGNVVSQTLLPAGTGLKPADQMEADRLALQLAKAARFAPLLPSGNAPANPLGRLTGGTLIFEWHTVPRPATNAPPAIQ